MIDIIKQVADNGLAEVYIVFISLKQHLKFEAEQGVCRSGKKRNVS